MKALGTRVMLGMGIGGVVVDIPCRNGPWTLPLQSVQLCQFGGHIPLLQYSSVLTLSVGSRDIA